MTFSAFDIDALREVGEAFMEDGAINVYRQNDDVTAWEDEVPETDYGDDEVDHQEPELAPTAFVGTFKAWIVSKLERTITTGDGRIELVSDEIVRVPVGSDIRPRDIIVFNATGQRRVVFDTNAADTWPEWMKLTLRGVE